MARIIVAAQPQDPAKAAIPWEDNPLRQITKLVINHLRQNGIITLSLPNDLPNERRAGWVKNTGYKADNGDLLIELLETDTNDGQHQLTRKSDQLSQDLANKLVELIDLKSQPREAETNSLLGQVNLSGISLALAGTNGAEYKTSSAKEGLAGKIVQAVVQALGISFKPYKKSGPRLQPLAGGNPAQSSNALLPSSLSNQPKAPGQISPVSPRAPSANLSPLDDFADTATLDFPTNQFGATQAPASFGATPAAGLGSNFAGGFTGNSFAANPNNPFNKQPLSRDERKEMIIKWYKKGFGKEPEQTDLNYFLNIGISEEQMLKRILESQDHVDMMANAKKYAELKEKFDQVDAKASSLERNLADQKEILEKLNALLLQKNYALSQLQKRVQALTNRLEELQNNRKSQSMKINYHGSALDRIFDYFSRRLS